MERRDAIERLNRRTRRIETVYRAVKERLLGRGKQTRDHCVLARLGENIIVEPGHVDEREHFARFGIKRDTDARRAAERTQAGRETVVKIFLEVAVYGEREWCADLRGILLLLA